MFSSFLFDIHVIKYLNKCLKEFVKVGKCLAALVKLGSDPKIMSWVSVFFISCISNRLCDGSSREFDTLVQAVLQRQQGSLFLRFLHFS